MHRAVPILIWLSACSFRISAAPSGDGGHDDGDAPIDSPIDSVDAYVVDVPMALCLTWDPHHFDACMIPAPAGALDLSQAGTYTLNTTAGTLLPPAGAGIPLSSATLAQGAGEPAAFLISVDSFIVRAVATLRVVGNKPLIVASWDTISVLGTINASSYLITSDPAPPLLITTTSAGAGSNPPACSNNRPTAGGDGNSGSGGGGGGGFHGAGGTGGRGDTLGPIPAGVGGTAIAAPPTIVRGGCSGAISGRSGSGAIAPSNSQTQSPAGPGGGAIQLTARNALSVAGTITAGGAGGGPAQRGSACGGGGAGSGGYIGLEGLTMTVGGRLAANGGGGGTSARFSVVERGHEGENGRPDATAAVGGTPDSTCSLPAPAGSAAATLQGGSVPAASTCDCGGAGGGGGAGFILTWGPANSSGASISPAVQAGPL